MDNSPFAAIGPARFDAYAATIPHHPRDVLEAFEGFSPGSSIVNLERPRQGYAFGATVADDDGQLGVIQWGGAHPHPHASFQGHCSHQAALLLRECFPDHSVARCDPVVLDTCQPGAYDVLQAACVALADELDLAVNCAGDHLVKLEGRTVYLGSPSSHVRARLYDKAAERRAKLRDPAKLAELPQHWARLELQIRPKGASAKRAAAVASPEQLIGASRWSQRLALEVAGLDVPRFDASPTWRESDHDRAYHAMLKQYRSVLYQVLADAGSPECFGLQLVHDLAQL